MPVSFYAKHYSMEIETICVCLGVCVAVLGVISLIYIFLLFRSDKSYEAAKSRDKSTNPASVMVVVGTGGHCTEILQLMTKLGGHYSPRYYVIANTDKITEDKVKQFESTQSNTYDVHKIPRSREVMQSWLTTVVSTVYATLYSFPLVYKLKPELILCNGPGTCIPICVAGYLLKLLCFPTKIIYVESLCRVETLSLSGKILYYFADHLIVNWPQLQEKYPKTLYLGRVY